MLDVYNVLAKSFRRVRDALREPTNHSLRLRIAGTRVDNDRRYELPTGTELAGLIPGDFTPTHDDRDIIVNNRATGLCRITSLNPLFDSLHFPLLFPYGNDGYHNRIRYNPAYRDPTKKRKYVTQREYYCFRLQYRQNEGKTLIRSGKALQHFCIDAFTTIEQNRLTYLRLNQKKLRSDLYKGLYDAPILVSNNCTGGVRYMQQLYQDAMALCRHYKNPDLFITFTFQKRGLPHVHIILWLADDCKPKTAALVDKIISAELPDPLIDPVGYDAVTKFMVHGPCGDSRPSSPCMKHGRCSKFFPKQFATETTFDSTGCVTYRRRETTVTAEKSNTILDNRHVVPYNRDLLVKYQAHINVEVCHKGQLIKYLFKYITKGPDRNQSVQAVVNRPDVEKTMLTEWFTLNRTYPSARKLTYAEIPQNFIWDKQCSQWVPRKQGFVIGRIASVPPQANDVFYLRLLLTKIPGALTFEDLRTVNGIRYNDYRQACQALGLLATDDEWNEVMAEVSRWGMPPLIRTTFVSLLMFCHVTSPTQLFGIAATLLPGGITAHSQFKIPIEVDHASTCAIKKGTTLARLLELATLIVWDEAPMVHKHSFEAVDRTLCDIMNKPTEGPDYKPFGGKTVILGGDFRQTLPVITHGTRGDNIEASLTRSYLWTYCTLLQLHTNMRVTPSAPETTTLFDGMQFSDWLLAVGDGRVTPTRLPNSTTSDWIHVPECFIIPRSPHPIKELINRVYPDLLNNYHNVAYIRSRAIVAPTNDVVTEINNYILAKLPGQEHIYLSSDTLTSPGTDQTALEIEYPTEFLNGLSYNGMPEHQLRFKQYSIVMLLRNLNPAAGLCNGTRILITHLGTNVIRGLIVGGTFEGTIAIIPRIVLDKTDPKWPFTLKRRQYPLRLCYGMTINKSQGQTLDQIGIFLPTPVFSHGQLYVALSRVRSAAGIHIVLQDTSKADYNCTRNIVYTEIFQDLQIQETSSVPRSM
ncbi:ATP-dependent DNA helicase PIF1 [Linum grandiflorum]